ncbi:MAG: RecX family transcriptional regulator [Saprospiraceae bacterium]|nr:RecX family transcriptional regulator [Saprospiraceae bacterium]HMW39403.1 regulatory protein RecX [Saprospiraceae bacterium]HMX88466.1 regulatory protein RecX [Saprospiraceae bacterium]HMZ40353.1 regulatory protein RecX [Saprospiraceae bacterium]HNA65748.1 regulatory protein RecX [Saprospiraceae bacterium]
MSDPYSGKAVFLEKMRRYCAYQERCQSEVIQKMKELKIDFEWQDDIIVSLIEEQYLNEERYTRAIVHGKFSMKSWGRIRIRQFLLLRNIHERMIDEMLKEIDPDLYLEKAKQVAEKKWRTMDQKTEPFLQKKQLMQYLYQKGYESAVASIAIDDIFPR